MPSDTLYLDFDNRDALAAIDRAIAALDDPARVLGNIGESLRTNIQDRFATEAGPDGTPWPALSPRYARRKARKHPGKGMLIADSVLHDTIVWQVHGSTLEVGTNTPYGRTHQLGDDDRNIPARPWLGTSPSDDEEILGIAHDYLADAFSGTRPARP